jgi:hypothetical protein
MIVLKTKYATENVPSTLRRREVADRHADRVAARRAIIARDKSIPWTGTPRRARGSAIRPVPTPSPKARPPPASPARTSTTAHNA